MVPSLLYLRSWQLCVRSVKLFSLCSLATGDEEDDQEGPEEDEEEEDGSASDDSDQMLDVERKAREIDRDRFTTTSCKPTLCAGQQHFRISAQQPTGCPSRPSHIVFKKALWHCA